MLHKNINQLSTRYIGANATLSNISVTQSIDRSQSDILTEQSSISTPVLTNTSPNDNVPQPKRMKKNMKENNSSSTPAEASKEEKPNKQPKDRGNDTPVSKLSIIAIGLTVCLGGFLYFNSVRQATEQQAVIQQLQTEISSLKETLQTSITDDIKANMQSAVSAQNKELASLKQQVTQQLDTQAKDQQQFVNKVDDAIKVSEQNLFNFNERLSAMSTTDNKIWLISQANYLVNLAGRKIWNDQDYTTARLLLKTADTSLAQANDPSLLPARQALNKDISSLASISFTDFDGIVMKLMQLTDDVTELPLVDNYRDIDLGANEHDDSFVDSESKSDGSVDESISNSNEDSAEVSSSLSNWYDNLAKSSRSFFNKFIEVEKYDLFSECITSAGDNTELLKKCQTHTAILMPEQALYLRENIKLRLFIAAQAVPRHQELIYQRSLDEVAIWINAYFDLNTSSVKAFINQLDELQKQPINNQNVPEKLSSQDELNKLMQTRVRAILAE